jgi:hypothetical protein
MLKTLKNMLKLTVLDMQLPHVDVANISMMGRYMPFNLEVSDRGAQFIAENLKNLSVLHISKQWSDSDENCVGYKGAIAIANGLKNLTSLIIGNSGVT